MRPRPHFRPTLTALEDRAVPSIATLARVFNNPFPANNDQFGSAVAASGDVVVVGAPYDDLGGVTDNGSAYVLNHATAVVRTLANPNPNVDDRFGFSVAVSGDVVVVGAPYDDPGGVSNAGTVYFFSASSGALLGTLLNPAPAAGDFFGWSVGVSGNRAVVGAFGDAPGGVATAGSAYVFDVSGAGTLVRTIPSPTPAVFGAFGMAVAISGNTVVAGAPYYSPGGVQYTGAAYRVSVDTGDVVPLANPGPAMNNFFGEAVAVSGATAVVGARGATVGGQTFAGSAHVFDAVTGAYRLTLDNPAPSTDDAFGSSVAVSGNLAVVGAPGERTGGLAFAGAAYTFDTTTGAMYGGVTDATPAANDYFGRSVAASGNLAAVGIPYREVPGFTDAGSAHVYAVRPVLTLAGSPVPEFRPQGTVAGVLAATPDAGTPVTFALVAGDGSEDNGSFQVVGNQLQTARPLDYAVKPACRVRVRATWADGVTAERSFVVTVTDDPLVSLTGRTLTVTGTAGGDSFGFVDRGAWYEVVRNSDGLAADPALVGQVILDGVAGDDAAALSVTSRPTTATLNRGSGWVEAPGLKATAVQVERVTAYGQSAGAATLNDSPGDDVFVTGQGYAILQGAGYANGAVGFGSVRGAASSGSDAAYFSDSAGDDVFVAGPTSAVLHGAGFWNAAVGFDGATGYASGGSDAAYLSGSTGDDVFSGTPTYSFLSGAGFWNTAVGFDGVNASGGGGNDGAYLTDSAGNDFFTGSGRAATLAGPGYFVGIDGFAGVNVYGTNGGTNRKQVGSVGYYLGFIGPWV